MNGPKRERGRPRKKPLVDAGGTNVTDKVRSGSNWEPKVLNDLEFYFFIRVPLKFECS